ncbi:hypothetical protein FRC03_010779, partial [Tulasnella sp. 419]
TFIFLWIVWILVLPLQILGNTYQRVPVIGTGSEAGNCQAKTPAGEFMSAPLYYLANLIFDAAASGIATVSLLRRGSASGKLGHFGKKVLKHGLLYAFASTFTNFMVTFALFDTKGLKVLGSFLSIGVTMILAQHLVLATAGIKTSTSGHCSSEDEFPDTSRHRSVSRDVKHRRVTTIGGTIVNVSSSCQGQARHMNADVTSPQLGSKFEPELGGIWVQTDTEIYQMAEDGDDIELKSPQHITLTSIEPEEHQMKGGFDTSTPETINIDEGDKGRRASDVGGSNIV